MRCEPPGCLPEFFLVIDGELFIDIEGGATVALKPHQGYVVPKGVVQRTRAPKRTAILMVESATVLPSPRAPPDHFVPGRRGTHVLMPWPKVCYGKIVVHKFRLKKPSPDSCELAATEAIQALRDTLD